METKDSAIRQLHDRFSKLWYRQSKHKGAWWLLAILLILLFAFLLFRRDAVTEKHRISTEDSKSTQVLSKEAVDELVKNAADKKYLQDVLSATSNLPRPKHPVPLKPADTATSLPLLGNGNQPMEIEDVTLQRCSYKGQTYVVGDIVKTTQGWVRCMPTFIFSSEKTERQFGSPAWIEVQ